MLETITAAQFAGLVDKTCWLEADGGPLEVTVHLVKENPRFMLPKASRMPFTVLLRGPESPAMTDGLCHLRVDGPEGWRLEEVFINRIMPPYGEPPGAYYQLVVC